MMHFILNFLTILIVSRTIESANSGECRLHINQETINNSWQSSSYLDQYCFQQHRELNSLDAYWYFHTADNKRFADDGYLWFVVNLKQVESINSVTIEARNNSYQQQWATNVEEAIKSRAANIEIWTTDSNFNFGTDRCNTTKFSSKFKAAESNSSWKYCGRTKSNILLGEFLTVRCRRHKVKMLLLRKYVATETDSMKQCMSFTNLWLNRVDLTDKPTRLKISVEEVECAHKRLNATFRFESSTTILKQEHVCRAFDQQGNHANLIQLEQPSCDTQLNAIKSTWSCYNCSAVALSTVSCSVIQNNRSVASLQKLYTMLCPVGNLQLLIQSFLSTLAFTLSLLIAAIGALLIALLIKGRANSSENQLAAAHHAALELPDMNTPDLWQPKPREVKQDETPPEDNRVFIPATIRKNQNQLTDLELVKVEVK